MIGINPQLVIKISQSEIEDFLQKNKGGFTPKELAKELKLSSGSIQSNLKRAIMHRTIIRRVNIRNSRIIEYSIENHQKPMERKKPLPVKELKEECGE